MNILLFSRGYPSKQDPQWGCFEKDQAIALHKIGHNVTIISIDKRFRWYGRKLGIRKYEDQGVTIYNLYLVPFVLLGFLGSTFQLWLFKFLSLYLYKSVEKNFKPDVIYAHYLPNIYAASFIKREFGVPLVGIEHWSQLNKDVLNPNVKAMGNVAYKAVDRLISVSESLRQRIYNHFGKDSIIVHNMVGLDFQNTSDIQKDKTERKGGINIISVGSLLYGKGYDVLISAFYKSKLYENGTKITIVGEGIERKSLENQIKSLNLQNNINLVGKKNKNEIIELLLASDLFIHPSRGENFSVAIIEGQAVGLPVIATLCGGAMECINEGNGKIVQIDDVDGLSNTMVYMYSHIDDYDREYISRECLSKYSSMAIAQQIDQILKNVIK